MTLILCHFDCQSHGGTTVHYMSCGRRCLAALKSFETWLYKKRYSSVEFNVSLSVISICCYSPYRNLQLITSPQALVSLSDNSSNLQLAVIHLLSSSVPLQTATMTGEMIHTE